MRTWHPGQDEPEESSRSVGIVDHTLDDASLESRLPLDDGRYALRSTCSAGSFDLLPPELMTEVLLALDLPSLAAFRQANSRAMGLVDSLHQYATVRRHCPNVLRAILSIRADSYDCKTLHSTLRTSQCASCERTAPYLYLISCKRVCYFCFTSDPAYLPATAAEATRLRKIKKGRLLLLPSVLSLPGRYTGFPRPSRRRLRLFDRVAMLKVVRESSGMAVEDMKPPCVDRTTRELRRYMAIVAAPYLDGLGRSADWGFYCMGCADDTGIERHFRNHFTKDGLAEHMARFGKVTLNGRKTLVIHAMDPDTN
ncbi:hypothetical protein E4U42_000055 [Claviceps africana]|uniref:F-box domain-containing protein n=1 Tax=Claviceps africana TaxID=83212 RepID=A0A8K0JAA3_9HYPO|nr:hypothetical protein E4U42_000055 [Claviceps africana]